MFQRVIKQLVQGQAYSPGATLSQIALPTDQLISKLIVTLRGTPTGAVGMGSSGNKQDQLWAPAAVRALGNFTIQGTPLDGSDGIQMKNIPMIAAYRDDVIMMGQQLGAPGNWAVSGLQADISDSAPGAVALQVTVPIHFMDETLESNQQLYSALDARRYGGQANTLQLSIQFGQLQAALGAATFDTTALVGGSYDTPVGPGSLVVDVAVEQIWPIGWTLPDWRGADALPMFDRDFEYYPLPALSIPNSNGIQLSRRNLQQYVLFACSRNVAATGIENPYNNLGASGPLQLVEKIGAMPKNQADPRQLQLDDQQTLCYGSQTWPTGDYAKVDLKESVANGFSLAQVNGNHTWDTNLGVLDTASGTYDAQNVRVFHTSYNPSAAAKAKLKGTALV